MAVTGTLIKANAAALYDEINNGATLTNTTIATNDLIGIADVSATTGKKITIKELANFINKQGFISSINSFKFHFPSTENNGKTPAYITFDGSPAVTYSNTSTYTSSGYVDKNTTTMNVSNIKLILIHDTDSLKEDRYGYLIMFSKTHWFNSSIRSATAPASIHTRTASETTTLTPFWCSASVTYNGTSLIFKYNNYNMWGDRPFVYLFS